MTGELQATFDAQWYCKRYPDVVKSGLEPLTHYLRYGERLGRKPCPGFDPLFYGECYPQLVASGASPLTHFVTFGQREGKRGHAKTVKEYTQQLWRREHVADCVTALISFSASNEPDQVRAATWALARWFAWQEDWYYCAHWLRLYYKQPALKAPWPIIQLLYCEALCRSGELAKAEQQANALHRHFPGYFDVYLALSNVYLSQLAASPKGQAAEMALVLNKRRIDAINSIYSSKGLKLLEVQPESVSLDSLNVVSYGSQSHSQFCKGNSNQTQLVSVILPVFNAEHFLVTAMQSLAMQSYANLEVLIVDDASTDNTRAIAEQFISQDTRFKLFCLPANQGAYMARNLGLKHAKGDFITVHDADDWSHPDKISCQVAAFQEHPEWLANTSDMVRCTTDLRFGRWRLPGAHNGGWIYRNTSSLMFKRQVFEVIGYWDRVRCTADTEYMHRIIAAFGAKSYGEIIKGVPLSFCRHVEGSLSQIGPLHLSTHDKGLRRDYMGAAKAWHAKARQPQDLFMPENPKARLFPAPELNLPLIR